MFVDAYFQVATHLFEQYELQLPLHLFLKDYFRSNKKYGSRDRKFIAELLYGIYRLGKQNAHISLKDRMIYGAFLGNRLPIIFFEKTIPLLADLYNASFEHKLTFLKEKKEVDFSIPFELSSGFSEIEYVQYLFQPSKVFIRVRKNHDEIIKTLKAHKIEFEIINPNCFSFDANVKLNEIIIDHSDYVIQDYASQQTGEWFQPTKNQYWWDCCAASGGKSLLVLDKHKPIDLMVSDIRESIIKNLHQRFQQYGFASKYVSLVADISDQNLKINKKFDVIVCDAPCGGSGTWSRSPEQYYFFPKEKLYSFHEKQTAILSNIIRFLKPNGKIFYITCSVFKYENEEVIKDVLQTNELEIVQQKLIQGSGVGGDNLYIVELLNK